MNDVFLGHRSRVLVLLLLALSLRLFLALEFPNVGGDSPIYENLARNLLHFGIYSHQPAEVAFVPPPSLIRTPGYPLFLAVIYAVAGDSNDTAVRMGQAFLDTFTCWLIALIVFKMARGELDARQRLAQAALGLAALCPFVANYTASILTEVPTVALMVAALLFAVNAIESPAEYRHWFLCGLFTGLATLFRPESGLWLVALIPALIGFAWRERNVGDLLSKGLVIGFGLLLPLVPWTARNLVTMNTFQPLAPVNAEDPGEFVPRGYLHWCRTWLWQAHQVEGFLWSLEESPLSIHGLPPTAIGGPAEREKLQSLFQEYNASLTLTPTLDDQFNALARQRMRAHPWKYYLQLPALRGLALWFTPRREILPLDGVLLPVRQAWESDPHDFLFTLLLFLINCGYVGAAVVGAWKLRRQEWLGLLLLLILSRTVFFAYFTFPEPRYVLEAYPAVIILAAFAFTSKAKAAANTVENPSAA